MLMALCSLVVLAAPAHAHAQQSAPNVHKQVDPWGDPDRSIEPDPSEDDDDIDDRDNGWPWAPGAQKHDGRSPNNLDNDVVPAEHNLGDALDEATDWGLPSVDLLESLQDQLPPVTSTTVPGTLARQRTDGKAATPRGAPKRVRRLIAHLNDIVGKRYQWGGGHAKLVSKGYDCSGAVSYGLVKAGLLQYAMVSGRLARWGEAGDGRWVTIYANKRHVYMEIAGLRLDTSQIGDDPTRTGVRWRPLIGKRDGFNVRHPAGL